MDMPSSQVLEILVIAMVAGIILFRLYTVLGRRTGHEPPPQQPGSRPQSGAAILPPQSVEPAKGPGGHGLLDIQLADRNFDTQRFIAGARTAYEMIITAFHKGDRPALKPLLSGDVFAAFDAAIGARGPEPLPAFTGLKDARIVGASLNGQQAEITVAFTAGFAGGKDATDVWTFGRRMDDENPNWALVATSGDLPE
jgi:predicted lipid-binding transport protein (Tim44 family)